MTTALPLMVTDLLNEADEVLRNMKHGNICKQCEGPAPLGVGYVDNSPGAYEASDGLEECECGQSKRAVIDLMSRYSFRNVVDGQADVYDQGQWVHRGTVYRVTGQPLDLEDIGGMWAIIYPDGVRAGQRHLDSAGSDARGLVDRVATNDAGATTLVFRTRGDAAQFALLTY